MGLQWVSQWRSWAVFQIGTRFCSRMEWTFHFGPPRGCLAPSSFIPVPQGSSGPTPVVNPQGRTTGSAYTGGSGGNGLDPKVTTVRIMDATPARGSSPGYPNGYVTYENRGGQGVNPQNGRTVPNSDPSRHQPLSPRPSRCPGSEGSCQ
jgi:hypothetical protein